MAPVVAGLSVGIPVIVGYFTGHLTEGKLVSLAGLVILYIHKQPITTQMITLMTCSFGLMLSFTIGIIFSFHLYLSCLVLGLYAFLVNISLFYLNMRRPPGNFFFIMIASVAICLPFDPPTIPHKIGLIGIGTMGTCLLGLFYCIFTARENSTATSVINVTRPNSKYMILTESITLGVFIGSALLIGRLLKLENPYWIPTTCAAVMQGASTKHIWQRSIQRIAGTLLGLIVTWIILLLCHPSPFAIAIGIMVLQIIIEVLVVRNYGIAVIFITVLTIFLAESGNALQQEPTMLITTRFVDILIGCVLGSLGGWILFNERIHFLATKQIRKTKVILTRRRSSRNIF